MEYEFIVERSRSAGSRCKRCNERIRRSELRIARLILTAHGFRPVWYHGDCIFMLSTRPRSPEQISGLDELDGRLEAEVRRLLHLTGPGLSRLIPAASPDNPTGKEPFIRYCRGYKTKCRVCNKRMIRGELQMGVLRRRGLQYLPDYFHVECFFASPPLTVRDVAELAGYRLIRPDDLDRIQRAYLL